MRGCLFVVLAACGSNSSAPDARVIGTFELTSPSLASDAAFDPANTCDGADSSPALVWTDAPAGAQSFAVVLLDNTITLVHWVIYDIPAGTTSLPANIDKVYAPTAVPGAHQTTSFQPPALGYLGPCPPRLHTYEFTAYALDVATLPDASMTTTGNDALATIDEHRLATGALSGTYVRP